MKNLVLVILIVWVQISLAQISKEKTLTEKLNDSAHALMDNAKYEKALKISSEALQRFDLKKNSVKTLADTYRIINSCFWVLGRMEGLLNNSKQAINHIKSLDKTDDTHLAMLYKDLAHYYRVKGNLKMATKHINRSLQILQRDSLKHPAKLVEVYMELYSFNQKEEALKKAIQYSNSRLKNYRKDSLSNQIEMAGVYDDLGNFYLQHGKPKKSLDCKKKVLQIRLSVHGKNHLLTSSSYKDVGDLYIKLNDYDKALIYFLKSLEILEKNTENKNPHLANTLGAIGLVYEYKRNIEKAKEYYSKALNLHRTMFGEMSVQVIYSYLLIGGLYKNNINGIDEKELEYYHLALKNFKQVKDKYSYPYIYSFIADYHYRNENYSQAKKYFLKVFPLHKNCACLVHVPFLVNNGLAKTYIKLDDLKLANHHLKKAARSLSYNISNPKDFENVEKVYNHNLNDYFYTVREYFLKQYESTKNKSYLDSLKQNNYSAVALQDYITTAQPLEQGSRQDYIAKMYTVYEKTIADNLLLNADKDRIEAFEIAEKSKSRLLAENLRVEDALTFSGIPHTLIKKEHDINIEIGYHQKKLFEQRDINIKSDSVVENHRNEIFNLQQQKDSLVERFQKEYPKYYQLKYDHKVLNVAETRNLLEENQGLVEYVVGEESIFIFLITKDDYKIEEVKKDFPLEQEVENMRKGIYDYWMSEEKSDSLYDATKQNYEISARKLYDKLIQPIAEHLPERLIIIPDGILGYVPFEVLITEDHEKKTNPKYLIENHCISYCYSATLLKEFKTKKQQPTKNFLAFAPGFGTDFKDVSVRGDVEQLRNSLSPLRYNKEEIENINGLINGDTFLDSLATKQKFDQIANQYQILHFATHGKANDKIGDYSYLAFDIPNQDTKEDGFLYVRDLYNQKLNADMVVLSACEAGVGEIKRGEGILSLARGFSYAGAKSVVTSLWNVNDKSTSELMVLFYENIKKGMPKDVALRQAKLALMKENKYADPFYWAGFIPIGDMQPIALKTSNTVFKSKYLFVLAPLLLLFIFLKRKNIFYASK